MRSVFNKHKLLLRVILQNTSVILVILVKLLLVLKKAAAKSGQIMTTEIVWGMMSCPVYEAEQPEM